MEILRCFLVSNVCTSRSQPLSASSAPIEQARVRALQCAIQLSFSDKSSVRRQMVLYAWPTRLTIVSWDRFSERDPVTGNDRRFRKSIRIRNRDMHVNPALVRAQGKDFDDYGVLTLRCADVVEKRPADSGRRNDE